MDDRDRVRHVRDWLLSCVAERLDRQPWQASGVAPYYEDALVLQMRDPDTERPGRCYVVRVAPLEAEGE